MPVPDLRQDASVDDGADPSRLLDLIGASWSTQVVRTAAELNVVDELAGGPRPIAEVAGSLDLDEDVLLRLVRALCSLELCIELEDGTFAATATGLLLAGGEGSLGPWARWWGGPAWAEWSQLPDAIRTGRAVRAGDGFDARSPEDAALFDDAMAALTGLDAPAIAEALALHGDELVADVGGGRGTLLRAVLTRHPDARGLLIERPEAARKAVAHIGRWGLADRLEVVGADAFEEVRAGAGAYVLKSVLHDWDDELARRLLTRCRAAAAAADARLLVVERCAPDRADGSDRARSTARMDLHMLLAQGGRERTEDELRSLLASADLQVVDVRAATATLSVIEARVARPGEPGTDAASRS